MASGGLGLCFAEQVFPDKAARGRARRASEKGAGGVADVFVQAVVGGEAPLEGDELFVRVALKRDKKQSGVELAAFGVKAVRKRVAAA